MDIYARLGNIGEIFIKWAKNLGYNIQMNQYMLKWIELFFF